jgi:hypothetical protein
MGGRIFSAQWMTVSHKRPEKVSILTPSNYYLLSIFQSST